MSYDEALLWAEYRRTRGSLNIATRLEYGFAMLAHLICEAHGIKVRGQVPKMEAFMPHKIEQPISLHDAMKQWV